MINYYKVGGCVRDELLGVRSKDIDFAVEAPSYEAMKEDLLSKGTIIWQERPEFFAIRGKHPEWGPVDFTLCRKEGFYSDNRHPDSVEVGTIYDDLARRDFTVNAIAWKDGVFIDPHNGTKDLANMHLRCVGNTRDRFEEDPLRILRAVRFHLVRGFALDNEIETQFNNYDLIHKLLTIPLERVYEEVRKCYDHNSWKTLQFFHKHYLLELAIFDNMGLALTPRII